MLIDCRRPTKLAVGRLLDFSFSRNYTVFTRVYVRSNESCATLIQFLVLFNTILKSLLRFSVKKFIKSHILDLTKSDLEARINFKHIKSKLENNDFGNLRLLDKKNTMIPETNSENSDRQNTKSPLFDEDGLIIPKKLPNPVKENIERQNLHRELLFNQKIGKNVLNQKTELQRALEKQKDNLAKKQLEEHIASQTPELEKVIADRVKRLQSSHEDKDEDDKVINKELLQIRMNLKTRNEPSSK